jgi:ribonuclease HII
MQPSFEYEAQAERAFGGPVAGIDEAGRGPWAGPVVAAAVVLHEGAIPDGLRDSKALSAAQRELLFDLIMETAEVGIGIADVPRIDSDNILAATLWAMGSAVRNLGMQPGSALVDGNRPPKLDCPVQTIVKGDALSLSIAAASIIAKVTRDRMMSELAALHPDYGFDRHKGYGTPQHRAALERFGVTDCHRRSFRPVRALLEMRRD